MAEGLKSALKEILSREVVGEETRGEVTAWNPGTSKEKPEQNLIATLEFSLRVHHPSKKYVKPNTVHYDFKPQTRGDLQSESELIFGTDTVEDIKLGQLDPVDDIKPLDLQLTPSSTPLNLTSLAAKWDNLPKNELEQIPTDPKTMMYILARNMIVNVVYMVALLANRMMAI